MGIVLHGLARLGLEFGCLKGGTRSEFTKGNKMVRHGTARIEVVWLYVRIYMAVSAVIHVSRHVQTGSALSITISAICY